MSEKDRRLHFVLNSTHDYVGSLKCGCGAAICVDEPDFPKDTAKSVAEMIKGGLSVQRLEHDQAVAAFSRHCEQYPHTDWQKRHEAARLKRRSELPLTADAVRQPTE